MLILKVALAWFLLVGIVPGALSAIAPPGGGGPCNCTSRLDSALPVHFISLRRDILLLIKSYIEAPSPPCRSRGQVRLQLSWRTGLPHACEAGPVFNGGIYRRKG